MPSVKNRPVAKRAKPSTRMPESEASISETSFTFMSVPGMGQNNRNSGKSPINSMKISLRSPLISLHRNRPRNRSPSREKNSLISRQTSSR